MKGVEQQDWKARTDAVAGDAAAAASIEPAAAHSGTVDAAVTVKMGPSAAGGSTETSGNAECADCPN